MNASELPAEFDLREQSEQQLENTVEDKAGSRALMPELDPSNKAEYPFDNRLHPKLLLRWHRVQAMFSRQMLQVPLYGQPPTFMPPIPSLDDLPSQDMPVNPEPDSYTMEHLNELD